MISLSLTVQLPTAAAVSGHPGKTAGKGSSAPAAGGRRVRTGIMPDFAFAGKGMKIGMVSPGSPAEKAGLKKDDIVIKVGETSVAGLKEYSNALKAFQPGDTVTFIYSREGKQFTTSVTLAER